MFDEMGDNIPPIGIKMQISPNEKVQQVESVSDQHVKRHNLL